MLILQDPRDIKVRRDIRAIKDILETLEAREIKGIRELAGILKGTKVFRVTPSSSKAHRATKVTKETKAFRVPPHLFRVLKDIKATKETRDSKENRQPYRGHKDTRDIRGRQEQAHRETKAIRVIKDIKGKPGPGHRVTRATRVIRAMPGHKEIRETKGIKDTKAIKEIKVTRGMLEREIHGLSVQGNQVTCSAQTVTNIFAGCAAAISTTYEYWAQISCVPALGTQGAQFGVQCSVAGATVEGNIFGFQTAAAMLCSRQSSQGITTTTPFNRVAGTQGVSLTGIIITPGSGSPVIGVQIKGVQASQAWYVKPNSFITIVKTS